MVKQSGNKHRERSAQRVAVLVAERIQLARNKPPSFDFYPDDFVGGTLGMHPTARGIYITLLCHQWSHGSIPNPTNTRQFVQITGAMPDELEQHMPEVLSKFERRENGQLVNARLEREYQRKMEICERRQIAGAKGGRPKANANQSVNQQGSKRKAKQEVGSRKKEVIQKEKESFDPTRLALPFSSEEFESAWGAFCRMRREIRKPMGQTGTEATLRKLAQMGEERAIAALEHTTANEWQGIREPELPHSGNATKTFAQQRVENTKQAIEDFANG